MKYSMLAIILSQIWLVKACTDKEIALMWSIVFGLISVGLSLAGK